MTDRQEIATAQAAYAARPVFVLWQDSHCSSPHRFATLTEAFAYIDVQWLRVRNRVRSERYNASNLRDSFIKAPGMGRVSLRYVLLAAEVSSY
jgi:hypothetical protein